MTPPTKDTHYRQDRTRLNHTTFPSSVFLSSCFHLSLCLLHSPAGCFCYCQLLSLIHPCAITPSLPPCSWFTEISALNTSQSTRSVCQTCQWSIRATWVVFWLPADFHFELLIKTTPLLPFFFRTLSASRDTFQVTVNIHNMLQASFKCPFSPNKIMSQTRFFTFQTRTAFFPNIKQ